MTYTRAWSSTTPLGTRAAKEIDDSSREKSVDIQERITSILATGTTIDTDPLAINPARVGNSTPVMTRYIIVQPANMVPNGINSGISNEAGASFAGGACSFFKAINCGIYVPVGFKIILVEAYLNRITSPSVTARLNGWTMNDGNGILDSGALTRSATGIGIVTSGALNRTVTSLDTFALTITTTTDTNSGQFYGARITVEVPNLALGY